jgi:hypothetical protein
VVEVRDISGRSTATVALIHTVGTMYSFKRRVVTYFSFLFFIIVTFFLCLAAEQSPGPQYEMQVRAYEEFLVKQQQHLELHVKVLEQQIAKQKRAKKTIQARQRQVQSTCE